MTQLTFLSVEPRQYGDIALAPAYRLTDPATSREAAQKPGRARTREFVADALRARGESGATDDELAVLCGLVPTSSGRRRKELQDAGLVVATGERRPTRTGASALVWKWVAA